MVNLGDDATRDVCIVDPWVFDILIDEKKYILYDEWYYQECRERFQMPDDATLCKDKYDSQRYWSWDWYGEEEKKQVDEELKECYNKFSMPLSPIEECEILHYPDTTDGYKVTKAGES